nr:MAG TPA: hypothetical protein [Bacteriophage sp.]DAY16780.1 MAG TPA: hypothetical protein [Caudoviricetes sp.]DAY83764.1 MAG TPA: hypothetical protein [Caudoviricetes sp.]
MPLDIVLPQKYKKASFNDLYFRYVYTSFYSLCFF